MSTVTVTSFVNPQNSQDGEFVELASTVSSPLTLTSGVRNIYSPGNYSLMYDSSANTISIYTWGELILAWETIPQSTYSFGNSSPPNNFTNTYHCTFDRYDRTDAAVTFFKTANSAPIGGGGGGAVCFLGAAPVLTPDGYKRIDSLAVGDLVRTADGRDVAIQRVKHQLIESPSAAVNPYVIPAGQFGAMENLAISPRHCVAVPGRGMVESRFLGLTQLSMRAAFDYYNLELPEWDNMVVAGVEVESLAPRKRVVMTVAQLAKLAVGVPLETLARRVTVLTDGKVEVTMTRKERRTKA